MKRIFLITALALCRGQGNDHKQKQRKEYSFHVFCSNSRS